jgi:penicillin-insensitive murein endopeptidase
MFAFRRFPTRSLRTATLLVALGSAGLAVPTALAAQRQVPKEFLSYPFNVQSLSVGRPNDGWQVRAKKLREHATLKIKAGSETHAYGHPALVLMLHRTAKSINKSVPGSVLLVGDLSAEEGGPLYGHFSHQSGRDADVGFYVKDAQGKSVNLKRFVAFDAQGRAKDGSGLVFDDYRNWLLIQSWAKDERAGLRHIFVAAGLRARLLKYGNKIPEFRPYVQRAKELLKQPERASAHDDHFHVRIACPAEQLGPCLNESKRGR